MRVPTATHSVEIEIKRSRFIAIALPLFSVADIKGHIHERRKAHPQANHVVHAAVVGKEGSEFSFSDDREPKNTAGRPMLEVLKGSGITNILVMVVRYFGGTLLGTGGLVKAYAEATKAVLQSLSTEELIDKSSLKIVVDYEHYDQLKLLLGELDGESKEEFATSITLYVTLPTINIEKLVERVTDLSSGRALIDLLDEPDSN